MRGKAVDIYIDIGDKMTHIEAPQQLKIFCILAEQCPMTIPTIERLRYHMFETLLG